MTHRIGEYNASLQLPVENEQVSFSSSQTWANNPSSTQSTIQPHPERSSLRSNTEACKRCCLGNCLMSVCRIFVLIVTFGCVDIDPPVGSAQEQPTEDIQNQTPLSSQINQGPLQTSHENTQEQTSLELQAVRDPLNLILDTSSGLFLKSTQSDTEVEASSSRTHRRRLSETHIEIDVPQKEVEKLQTVAIDVLPKGLEELDTLEEVTKALDGYPVGSLWTALEEMESRSPFFKKMEEDSFVVRDEHEVLKQRYLNSTYSPTAVMVEDKKCIPANWIRLPSEIPFIACQAPLQGDESFFAMLEQYRVKHIVVLVNEEVEPRKVHAYWKAQQCGYKAGGSENVNDHYKKHTLVKGENTIFVHQYLSWPDHGIPATTESMKEFLEKTHEEFNETSEPVVVHCSAGMGRGGTYIATHYLNYVKKPNDITDIAKTIVTLRSCRIGMIQTEKQFDFIKQMMGFQNQDI